MYDLYFFILTFKELIDLILELESKLDLWEREFGDIEITKLQLKQRQDHARNMGKQCEIQIDINKDLMARLEELNNEVEFLEKEKVIWKQCFEDSCVEYGIFYSNYIVDSLSEKIFLVHNEAPKNQSCSKKRSELQNSQGTKDIVSCFKHFEDCPHYESIVLEFEDKLIMPKKKTIESNEDQFLCSEIMFHWNDYYLKDIFIKMIQFLKSNSKKKLDYQSVVVLDGISLRQTLFYKNNS